MPRRVTRCRIVVEAKTKESARSSVTMSAYRSRKTKASAAVAPRSGKATTVQRRM